MRHAGPAILKKIEILLGAIRTLPNLKEKSRGVFYRRSKAFLHFHEDPNGIFADMRPREAWERFDISSNAQQKLFLGELRLKLNFKDHQ